MRMLGYENSPSGTPHLFPRNPALTHFFELSIISDPVSIFNLNPPSQRTPTLITPDHSHRHTDKMKSICLILPLSGLALASTLLTNDENADLRRNYQPVHPGPILVGAQDEVDEPRGIPQLFPTMASVHMNVRKRELGRSFFRQASLSHGIGDDRILEPSTSFESVYGTTVTMGVDEGSAANSQPVPTSTVTVDANAETSEPSRNFSSYCATMTVTSHESQEGHELRGGSRGAQLASNTESLQEHDGYQTSSPLDPTSMAIETPANNENIGLHRLSRIFHRTLTSSASPSSYSIDPFILIMKIPFRANQG